MAFVTHVHQAGGNRHHGPDMPENPVNGDTWWDGNVLRYWSGLYWNEMPRTSFGDGGYSVGGKHLGSRDASTIDKLRFYIEDVFPLAARISAPRYEGAGFASSVAGYTCGGGWTSYNPWDGQVRLRLSTIDKLNFSDETNASMAVGLSETTYAFISGFASSVAGYVAGGLTPTGGARDIVERLTFSSETRSTSSAKLAVGAAGGPSSFASSTAGYACGGYNLDTINKLVFAADAMSVIGARLSKIKACSAGGLASILAGYIPGGFYGYPHTWYDDIDSLGFGNESRVLLQSRLAVARFWGAGHSSMLSGYCSGGVVDVNSSTGPGRIFEGIDRLSFQNNTCESIARTLASPRYILSGYFENV